MRLGKGHRTAVPTMVDDIRFPSKTEARVYRRLRVEAVAENARLYRQVRIPLLNLAPNDNAVPLYITIDFGIVYLDGRVRLIDAKAKKWKSPEWLRGQKAAEAFYGIQIELTDK